MIGHASDKKFVTKTLRVIPAAQQDKDASNL